MTERVWLRWVVSVTLLLLISGCGGSGGSVDNAKALSEAASSGSCSSVASSGSSGIFLSSSSLISSSSSEKILSSSSPESSSSMDRHCVYSAEDNTLSCPEKTYRTVEIGGRTWMAENLDYEVPESFCYNDSAANCEKYGRLYSFGTAVCPDGWYVPEWWDWQALYDSVEVMNGDEYVGTSLKTTTDWVLSDSAAQGTDRYGFSVLPAGMRGQSETYGGRGSVAKFWTSSVWGDFYSYFATFSAAYEGSGIDDTFKAYLLSVRCIMSKE